VRIYPHHAHEFAATDLKGIAYSASQLDRITEKALHNARMGNKIGADITG
jgi:hypothetical protein